MDKKTAETINKVIAVLGYVGAGILILLGLFMTLGANTMMNYMAPMMYGGLDYINILGPVFVFMGIVMIGLGVLSIFVSKGLWEHRNWARIITLIFAVIGAVTALFSLPVSIISLAINVFVVYFYGFEKTTISLFK